MFSSLRTRLWLSYTLLVLTALGVVAVVLLIYVARNPSVYRQASQRLGVIQAGLLKKQAELFNLPADAREDRLDQVAQTYSVRILIFGSDRRLVYDSGAGEQATLDLPRLPRLRTNAILTDGQGQRWIYLLRRLDNNDWLMVAVERPRLPLLSILSDEFMPPLLAAGAVALALSLLLAFWLSRWIGGPLQQVVLASRRMGVETPRPVPLSGPREVKELTEAFNEMAVRLQASQESQRQFVANVSHELKTPLTSIQGFAQALQDGTADTTEARQQAAEIIQQEAARMHRMVLDLLDLARLDAGTMNLQHARVEVRPLLGSLVEKFALQAQAAGVALQAACPELPPLVGDGDRLAQVFSNLIDNALQFTPPGGRVGLQALPAGDGIRVEVSDTGHGIPPEALTHIFERFYQVDRSRPGGKRHGAGLGLAISKEIVTAHGGTISVRSAPGQGTTFIVNLPLSRPDDTTLIRRKS